MARLFGGSAATRWRVPAQSQVWRPETLRITTLTGQSCVSRMNTPCIHLESTLAAEVGLRIRIDEELRREFIEVCRVQDMTGAQVLRAFMRSYVEHHASALRQADLFARPQKSTQ